VSAISNPQPAHKANPGQIAVHDLGRMPYADAYALQRTLQQDVIAAREQAGAQPIGHLLLVEHDPPVITVSRRKSAASHLIASERQLAKAGVAVAETDRGGDITYHGPGQLVAYPILDLNRLGLRMHSYMRFLEQIVIDTLASWNIAGQRDSEATGVWVSGPSRSPRAKIAAMGVRVSRWVSMHGLALNVRTNLDHFKLIVPCGLHGRTVTSMRELLGDACPSMGEVKARLTTVLLDHASSHAIADNEPNHLPDAP